MPDGSRLVNPQELGPGDLQLNMWVSVRGRPSRITNMHAVGATGRMIELAQRQPVYLRAGDTMTVYQVAPPLSEDTPGLAPPPPPQPRRRRASPGAARPAPARRRRR